MRVAIYTLGCKTNQYETELIRESFESHGDIVVSFHNNADLYIINSCVVTSKAEAETRKAVHRAKRTNSNAKIIITSCFAKLHPDFKENNIFLYTGERRSIASRRINKKIFRTYTSHNQDRRRMQQLLRILYCAICKRQQDKKQNKRNHIKRSTRTFKSRIQRNCTFWH